MSFALCGQTFETDKLYYLLQAYLNTEDLDERSSCFRRTWKVILLNKRAAQADIQAYSPVSGEI